MAALGDAERSCLARYCAAAARRLGPRLLRIVLFGSAARGDMWPDSSPMHSDLDVLVVTREKVTLAEEGALVDATYPLFLEFGRQVSPHVFSGAQLDAPESALARELFERVAAEGVVIWSPPTPPVR